MAVPIFLVATAVNLVYVWRHRAAFGVMAISLLMAALSLWNAIGYGLLAAGFYPEMDPPLSVVWLRPSVLITGVLFTIIPGWLVARAQQVEDVEQVKEMLTKAHFRQQQITALETELASVRQLLEMCQAVNEALKKKYEQR